MIRLAEPNDMNKIWELFQAVIKTEDTYVFSAKTPESDLRKHWLADYMQTYVYVEENKILGTYILKPNQIDLGNHIANASYMVHPEAQGKGIGKKMAEHSLKIAKENGFLGMQFNIVISTNHAAVKLWQKLGFSIIGTSPKAFKHSELGYVDTYVMYAPL